MRVLCRRSLKNKEGKKRENYLVGEMQALYNLFKKGGGSHLTYLEWGFIPLHCDAMWGIFIHWGRSEVPALRAKCLPRWSACARAPCHVTAEWSAQLYFCYFGRCCSGFLCKYRAFGLGIRLLISMCHSTSYKITRMSWWRLVSNISLIHF